MDELLKKIQSNLNEWLVRVAFGVLVYFANSTVSSLNQMTDSVRELNTKIAVLITRTDVHEKRLDTQAGRINGIEQSLMRLGDRKR